MYSSQASLLSNQSHGGVEPQQRKSLWTRFKSIACGGKFDEEELNDVEPLPFLQLFRFTSGGEKVLLLIGLFCAMLEGLIYPLLGFVTGMIATVYISTKDPIGNDVFLAQVFKYAFVVIGTGGVCFVLATTQRFLIDWVAELTVRRIRREFIIAVLRQDSQFLDSISAGALSSQLNDNIDRIREGMGPKVALFVRAMAICFSAISGSFYLNWRIALSMVAVVPVCGLVTAVMAKVATKPIRRGMKVVEEANGLTEECICNVKTVVACNGQKTMIDRLQSTLSKGITLACQVGFWNGMFEGAFAMVQYIFFVIGVFYGVTGYHEGWVAHGGDVLACVNVMTHASFVFAYFSPHFTAVLKARISAAIVYRTIDRRPPIPVEDVLAVDPTGEECSITFSDVHFSYPTRPAMVLNGLSWSVKEGENVALVGKSGCGKSTSIGLVSRLFNPCMGTIRIGSHPIGLYNLKKLRKMIGIVSQEPVVFNGTIRENIDLGRNLNDEQVEEAAKTANAHTFIKNLEKGYETVLGSSGIALSGGQKQRVAIARAIATNPKILLLDEATSALDSHSERIVQTALNRASAGRTTVVVAHRLSTIRDVNRIFVIDEGRVIEEGTYEELSKREEGMFAEMVMIQNIEKHHQSVDEAARLDIRKSRESTDRRISISSASATEGEDDEKDDDEDEDESSTASSEETVDLTFPSSEGGLLKLYALDRTKILLMIAASVMKGFENILWAMCLYGVFLALRFESGADYMPLLRWVGAALLALGVFTWLTTIAMRFTGSWAGEHLMAKMRVKAFESLMHRPIAFFDRKETSTSACSVILAQQPPLIQAAADFRIAVLYESLTCTVGLSIMCLFLSPPNGILCVITIVIYCALFMALEHKNQKINDEYDNADTTGEAALEAFANARAIQLLTVEDFFMNRYTTIQEKCWWPLLKRTICRAFVYSITKCFYFLTWFLSTTCGSYFVYRGDVTVERQYTSEICVVNVCHATSVLDSFDDIIAASTASKRLFKLVDSQQEDMRSGKKPAIQGSLTAREVAFAYPSRPRHLVAENITFDVPRGKSLALVGPSGGGKSTIVNLLERFYEPREGYIAMDSTPISTLSLPHLRENVALVSQEPVLFRGTIADNVRLGCEDVSIEDIREACRLANASDFIESFPEGYETHVGEKGRSLSGGQKQRIAIARALVRRPKVVVLDEATSALDSHSQRAVKMALEESAKGRTSVVIAHRLDTVRHCDEICYVEWGRIVERGNHDDLMKKDGKYAALVMEQKLL